MRKMFSKNQIKEIVNQGIESGDVQVGTKLYLHTLSVTDENDQEQELFVVSLSSNTFSLSDIALISVSLSIYDSEGYQLILSLSNTSLYGIYDGALEAWYQIASINSDEVTPL